MTLIVKLDFPTDLEDKIRSGPVETEVKEAYALELFRQGRLSHYELSRALGLDRFATDAFLKRHNAFEGSLTMEELDADRRTLEQVLGTG